MTDYKLVPVEPTARPWMVFNIGCIECSVSSAVVGLYETESEALAVADVCQKELDWREGGQNSFEVFNLLEPQHDDYREVIESAGLGVKK